MSSKYPTHLSKLISLFQRLPGVGRKSAERIVFHLLESSPESLAQLSQSIQDIHAHVYTCQSCGAISDLLTCSICSDSSRQRHLLCVVAHAKEIFLIESTKQYRGLYYVLGNVISPMRSQSLADDCIQKLKHRIDEFGIEEVILALDATVEGEATALFLKKQLHDLPLFISRLACGVPIGSSFDFIDGGTLSYAIGGRSRF